MPPQDEVRILLFGRVSDLYSYYVYPCQIFKNGEFGLVLRLKMPVSENLIFEFLLPFFVLFFSF